MIKNAVLISFLWMMTILNTSAQPGSQHKNTFRGSFQREVQSDFLLYLPDGYSKDKDVVWPLLVFLHGSGERGRDIEKVKVHGPPKLIDQGMKFPFIILSPQCPDSTDWDAETLFALIKSIVSGYKVDEKSIFVTGLSMGGWATWDLAMAHPGYFAAIAPVCGRVNRNYPLRASEIKNLPVWVFHGAADDVVNINESASMVKALADCGNNARFTIYPTSGHDSWTETYANPELYKWFLSNRRK